MDNNNIFQELVSNDLGVATPQVHIEIFGI